MKPSQLIDPADRLRLEAAVFQAERATAGEIVVVVTAASDTYGSVGWRLGCFLALAAFIGLGSFVPPIPLLGLLGAQATGLLLGHGLARSDAVRRWLISERLAEQRVQQRALRAFAENGLRRTAGRTGLLLFVSLLERRVVVLADEGVNQMLDPDESWQEVVDLALAGLREGRASEGLQRAVERCGQILARHLPAPERNLDELPAALVLVD